MSLDAVLVESSFVGYTRTGTEIRAFFTCVPFTNDHTTSEEKMILGDKEVRWSAGQGVCPWAERTGPTAGARARTQPGAQGSLQTWQKSSVDRRNICPFVFRGKLQLSST